MNKYPLKDELGKSMVVFEKAGQFYGHIIKERTEKTPAKFVFETSRYRSLELLKADYPPAETNPV